MQQLRQLHKEFKSRAADSSWQVTKRKRLVRPFSQGDVGKSTSPLDCVCLHSSDCCLASRLQPPAKDW